MLEQPDAIEAAGDVIRDDHVGGLRAQLVDRLDRRARGLDLQPEAAEELRELADRLGLRMRHQGTKPTSHALHYIRRATNSER